MKKKKNVSVAPSLWTLLCHAALDVHKERSRDANSGATSLCLKRECEGTSCRATAEEDGACDKGSCGGTGRWSSCVDDET